MHYCSDYNSLFFNPVDDSIAVSEPLPNAFICYFRNYATRVWEMGKVACGVENRLYYCASIGGRVSGNVLGYRLQIFDSSWRPGYSVSHFSTRRSTSSCETVP